MSYSESRRKYAAIGVNTDKVIGALARMPISLHC